MAVVRPPPRPKVRAVFESIVDALVAVHEADQASPKAILAGLMVSVTSGIVGCLVILRRTAFLADAVSHAMLAGVVAGYLLMRGFAGGESDWGLLVSSLLAGLLTVLLVGGVVRYSRIKEDTAIGIMYATVFALGGVLHSLFNDYIHVDIVHFIQGQLLAIGHEKLWMTATVCGLVLLMFVWFYRPLQLVSFDPVMAASLGVPVTLVGYLLTTCTSLVVVTGVNLVGVILVVGMLIIPAATAYLFSDRLPRMMVLAGVFGATGFLSGFFLARLLDAAPGPSVILATGLQFGVMFTIAPRYGLLAEVVRRRGQADLPLREDVLRALGHEAVAGLDASGGATTASIAERLPVSQAQIRVALARLARTGLVEETGAAVHRLALADGTGREGHTEGGGERARRPDAAGRAGGGSVHRVVTPAGRR